MKGIIFNLLQEVIEEAHGETTWEALLSAAGVEGSYTSLGSYSDAEFLALIHAASDVLGQPADELVRWIGEQAMPLLASRYPEFFEGHASVQPFLATLNRIIHPEVRKIYPGASVPDFDFQMPTADVLVLGYRSERQLCALAEGFIIGAAAHFGQRVTLEQPRCMLRGDERCLIRCTFTAVAPNAAVGHG